MQSLYKSNNGSRASVMRLRVAMSQSRVHFCAYRPTIPSAPPCVTKPAWHYNSLIASGLARTACWPRHYSSPSSLQSEDNGANNSRDSDSTTERQASDDRRDLKQHSQKDTPETDLWGAFCFLFGAGTIVTFWTWETSSRNSEEYERSKHIPWSESIDRLSVEELRELAKAADIPVRAERLSTHEMNRLKMMIDLEFGYLHNVLTYCGDISFDSTHWVHAGSQDPEDVAIRVWLDEKKESMAKEISLIAKRARTPPGYTDSSAEANGRKSEKMATSPPLSGTAEASPHSAVPLLLRADWPPAKSTKSSQVTKPTPQSTEIPSKETGKAAAFRQDMTCFAGTT